MSNRDQVCYLSPGKLVLAMIYMILMLLLLLCIIIIKYAYVHRRVDRPINSTYQIIARVISATGSGDTHRFVIRVTDPARASDASILLIDADQYEYIINSISSSWALF